MKANLKKFFEIAKPTNREKTKRDLKQIKIKSLKKLEILNLKKCKN